MRYFLFFLIFVLTSCKQTDLEESDQSKIDFKSKSFNLKKLKSFVNRKLDVENKRFRSITKMASTTGTQDVSYDDVLLWDYAMKEIVNEEVYSYNVPIRESIMKNKLESYLPDNGYRVLNFYTDSTYNNIYARLREYRPDPVYIDSVCQAKNISMVDYNYLDYHTVLQGEEFDGYIVVYNLDNTPFKLVQVKKGIVKNVTMYNNTLSE